MKKTIRKTLYIKQNHIKRFFLMEILIDDQYNFVSYNILLFLLYQTTLTKLLKTYQKIHLSKQIFISHLENGFIRSDQFHNHFISI